MVEQRPTQGYSLWSGICMPDKFPSLGIPKPTPPRLVSGFGIRMPVGGRPHRRCSRRCDSDSASCRRLASHPCVTTRRAVPERCQGGTKRRITIRLRSSIDSVVLSQNDDLAMPDEVSRLQFRDRLPQLFLRVHHDRTIPCHRFLDRFTGHEEKPNSLRSRLDSQLISSVE